MWDTSDLNLSSLISLTPVPSDGAIVSAMRIGLILLLAWLTVSLPHKLIRTFRERLTTKVRLRDEDGNVHFAPNGSITSVV